MCVCLCACVYVCISPRSVFIWKGGVYMFYLSRSYRSLMCVNVCVFVILADDAIAYLYE